MVRPGSTVKQALPEFALRNNGHDSFSSHILFCELPHCRVCWRILAEVSKTVIMLVGVMRALNDRGRSRKWGGQTVASLMIVLIPSSEGNTSSPNYHTLGYSRSFLSADERRLLNSKGSHLFVLIFVCKNKAGIDPDSTLKCFFKSPTHTYT